MACPGTYHLPSILSHRAAAAQCKKTCARQCPGSRDDVYWDVARRAWACACSKQRGGGGGGGGGGRPPSRGPAATTDCCTRAYGTGWVLANTGKYCRHTTLTSIKTLPPECNKGTAESFGGSPPYRPPSPPTSGGNRSSFGAACAPGYMPGPPRCEPDGRGGQKCFTTCVKKPPTSGRTGA